MGYFDPRKQLMDSDFKNWLSEAVKKYWFSGNDRKVGSKNIDMIYEIQTNNDLWCCGIEESGNLGIMIVVPCTWETSVIGRPAVKILFLGADSHNIALALCGELKKYITTQKIFFISADPGESPAYLVSALEKSGFYLAVQSYYWIAKAKDVLDIAKRYSFRYTLRFATAEDASAVANVAKDTFVYGRYVSDPNLPNELGQQLYSEWAILQRAGGASSHA